METWGSKKVASDEARTMSASATKCRPPPAQTPLTAAITGLETPLCQPVMRSSARLVRRDCSRRASGLRASSTTSRPDWKRAATAGVHDDTDCGVCIELLPRPLELGQHDRVHGVGRLGTVEDEPADAASPFHDEGLVPVGPGVFPGLAAGLGVGRAHRQRPVKRGGRFSLKAASPSRKSSLRDESSRASASCSSWRSKADAAATCSSHLVKPSVTVGPAASGAQQLLDPPAPDRYPARRRGPCPTAPPPCR